MQDLFSPSPVRSRRQFEDCASFKLASKERYLVAGWVPGVLLSPIQGMVSASLADGIQYVKAGSTMVALFAAVVILVEGPADDEPKVEPVPE